MKHMNRFFSLIILVLLSFGSIAQTDNLSQQEKNDLVFMAEEEKLAKDVYVSLNAVWNLRQFTNIIEAEKTHQQVLEDLIKGFDLTMPEGASMNTSGVFSNPKFQALYDKSIKTGKKSEEDALAVAAKIEEVDIKDLQRALENTSNEKIKLVYMNLKKGSENHLNAFVKALKMKGVIYTPSVLPEEEYTALVVKNTEKGKCCAGKKGNKKCSNYTKSVKGVSCCSKNASAKKCQSKKKM